MKYEDYEVASIPYWCRNCDTAVDGLLRLPEPIAIPTVPIYSVCECCYNALCNEELPHERDQREKEMLCEEQDPSVMTNSV